MRLFAVVFLLSSITSIAFGSTQLEDTQEFINKELLVKFKSGFGTETDKAIADIGAKLLEKLRGVDVSRLELPHGLSVEGAVERFRNLPFVSYAEPNYIRRPCWSPSDPKYPQQWGLKKINVAAGWGIQTGSSHVKVAIVDTGVDLSHPDLKQNIVSGYDFVNDDTKPDDLVGHGTHCAGIAAAEANNGIGVAGVCPNCSIMPVQVLGPSGGSVSTVAKGIVWAADHGAQVISMSLGSSNGSTTESDAVQYAVKKGVLLIAAAGNDRSSAPHYPAYNEACIAVGSVDENDRQSSFSNYGNWVDVAAPGSAIVSTVPKGGYENKSGTSMAAPYVAGLAGLLFSCPGATADKVRKAIELSAVPVGGWVQKGRIDVAAALEKMDCRKEPVTTGNQGKSGSKESQQPTKKQVNYSPSGFKLNNGKQLSAPSNSLVHSDDKRLVLQSKGQGLISSLDFFVTAELSHSKSIESLQVSIEASSQSVSQMAVYVFNWKSEKWDWLGKLYLGTADKVSRFNVQNHENYVSSKKEIRIKLYKEEKRWKKVGLSTDWVLFETIEKIDETAPTQEPKKKSTTEKVKEKWKKWTGG
jgi:thermitase